MEQSEHGTIPVRIDKNTVVYVREGADVEAVKEKFLNRKGKGDYTYLFHYNEQRNIKTKNRTEF